MLIVKDKYGMWSTPCSNKDKTLTYWLSVGFVGKEPTFDKKGYIEPSKSFYSAYSKKDGSVCPKVMIMEFTTSDKPGNDEIHAKTDGKSFIFVDDDLPF